MIKKFFLWFGILVFVGIGSLIAIEAIHHIKMSENKGPAQNLADSFMNCLNKEEDTIQCKRKYMSVEADKSIPDEPFVKFTTKLKSKLGNRSISGLIDETWKSQTSITTGEGKKTYFTFSLNTIYRNDAKVKEDFIAVFEGEELKLQKAHVNSDRMME